MTDRKVRQHTVFCNCAGRLHHFRVLHEPMRYPIVSGRFMEDWSSVIAFGISDMWMDGLLKHDNLLLASLDNESSKAWKSLLQPTILPIGYKCVAADRPIKNVYFPTSGIILRTVCEDRPVCVDAGLYGRDGFSGVPLAFGIDRSPHEDIVQVTGAAFRAPAQCVVDLLQRDPSFSSLLLRFAHCLSLQASCSALSNRTDEMVHRLSRLLVMCLDRSDGHELGLTHGFLATALGVRRSSVTAAMHHLEGDRLIKATRGRVKINDREALEVIAGDNYGVAEREYDRLIAHAGRPWSRAPAVSDCRWSLR